MTVVYALLLSVVFPGAGQAFNGELKKGVGFAAFFLLAPVPLLFLTLSGYEWAMWMIGGVKVATPLVSIVDAGGRAYETRAGKRKQTDGGWKPGLAVLAVGLTSAWLLKAVLTLAVAVFFPDMGKST